MNIEPVLWQARVLNQSNVWGDWFNTSKQWYDHYSQNLGGSIEVRALVVQSEMHAVVDALLNHCGDPECLKCGEIICPHGEPLHFHHDGCPSCCQGDDDEHV